MSEEASQFGYADSSWAALSAEDRALHRRIRPLPRVAYAVNHAVHRLENTLAQYASDSKEIGGTFDLVPDFQRGHVWHRDQQIAYIENVFRGTAPMVFKFNSPSYGQRDDPKADLAPGDFVCVDGLQRLTALRAFIAGDIKAFGDLTPTSLTGTSFDLKRMNWTCTFEVFDFTRRSELLQFYLDLNSGGTIHAPEELARVRGLLEVAIPAADAKPSSKRSSGPR